MTRECVRVLRGRSSAFTPREALRMLAHLVGDMHQPLHVGNAFVSAARPLRFVPPDGPTGWRTTSGGNALVYGPQDRFNLHSYWDTHIVNLAMRNDDVPAFAARLIAEVPPGRSGRTAAIPTRWPEALGHRDPRARRAEAYRDIRITTLPRPGRVRADAAPLADRAAARLRRPLAPGVRTQLAKGGYRLAGAPAGHLAVVRVAGRRSRVAGRGSRIEVGIAGRGRGSDAVRS